MERPGKLRDTFDTIHTSIDNEDLDWNNMGPRITANLNKKKKRRGFFFLLFSSLIVLIGGLSYVFIYEVDNTNTSIYSNQVPSNNQTTEGFMNNDVQSSSKIINTPINLQKKNSTVSKSIEIPARELVFNTPNKQTSLQKSDISVSKNIKNDSFVHNWVQKSPKKLITSTLNQISLQSNASNHIDRLTDLTALPVIFKPIEFTESKILSTQDSTLNHARSKSWSIYLHSGLSTNTLSKNITNTEQRLGGQFELGVMIPIRNQFTLSTGIALFQDRLQTTFNQIDTINIYQPNTISSITQYPGGNEQLTYTDSIAALRTRSLAHTNTYTQLTIPIQIGYTMALGSFNLIPAVGIDVIVVESMDFKIADQDFKITDYRIKNNVDLGISFRASLQAEIYLTDQWSGSARYLFTSARLPDLMNIESKLFYRHSVQLGISYHF